MITRNTDVKIKFSIFLSVMLFFTLCFTAMASKPNPIYKPATIGGSCAVFIGITQVTTPELTVFVMPFTSSQGPSQGSNSGPFSASYSGNGYDINIIDAVSKAQFSTLEDAPTYNYFMLNGGDILYPIADIKGDHYIGSIHFNQNTNETTSPSYDKTQPIGAPIGNLYGTYTRVPVPFTPAFFLSYKGGFLNFNPPSSTNPKNCSLDFYGGPSGTNALNSFCSLNLSSNCDKFLGVIPVDDISPDTGVYIVCYSEKAPTSSNKSAEIFHADTFNLPTLVSYSSKTIEWSNLVPNQTFSPVSSQSESNSLIYISDRPTEDAVDESGVASYSNYFSNWYLGGYPDYDTASYKWTTPPVNYETDSNRYGLCVLGNNFQQQASLPTSGASGTYGKDYYFKSDFFPLRISSDLTKITLDQPIDSGILLPKGSMGEMSTSDYYSDGTTEKNFVVDISTGSSNPQNTNKQVAYYSTHIIFLGGLGDYGDCNTADGDSSNISIIGSNLLNSEDSASHRVSSKITAASEKIKDAEGNYVDIPPLVGIIMGWPPFPEYVWYYYSQPGLFQMFWSQHLLYSIGKNQYTSSSFEHQSSVTNEEDISMSLKFTKEFPNVLGMGAPAPLSVKVTASESFMQEQSSTSSHLNGNSLNQVWQEIPPGIYCDPHVAWAVFSNDTLSFAKVSVSSFSGGQIDFGSGNLGRLTQYIPTKILSTGYDFQYFDLRHPELSPYPAVAYLLSGWALPSNMDIPEDFAANNPPSWAAYTTKTHLNPISNTSNRFMDQWKNSGCSVYYGGQFSANFGSISSLEFSQQNTSSNSTTYSFTTGTSLEFSGGGDKNIINGGISIGYTNTKSSTNTWTDEYGSTWSIGLAYETMAPNAFGNCSGDIYFLRPNSDMTKDQLYQCTWITDTIRESGSAPWLLTFDNIYTDGTVDEAGDQLPTPIIIENSPMPQIGEKYGNGNVVYSTIRIPSAIPSLNELELVLLSPNLPYEYFTNGYELVLTDGMKPEATPNYYYILNPSSGTNCDSIVANDGITIDEKSVYNNYPNNLVTAITQNLDNSYSIIFAPNINLLNTIGGLLYRRTQPGTLPSANSPQYSNYQTNIFFADDIVDQCVVILYNSTLYYIDSTGLHIHTFEDFAVPNCMTEINGTLFVGTNNGIYSGDGINSLYQEEPTKGKNIISISSYFGMLSYGYINSDGSISTNLMYINGNPLYPGTHVPTINGKLEAGTNISTDYGNIEEVWKICTINNSTLFLCVVDASKKKNHGESRLYITGADTLYTFENAVNSQGGNTLLESYSSLSLDTDTPVYEKATYPNPTESILPSKTSSNSYPIDLADGSVMNILFMRDTASNSLICQTVIQNGTGNATTYIFTPGMTTNQIIYRSCPTITLEIKRFLKNANLFYLLLSDNTVHVASIINHQLVDLGVLYASTKTGVDITSITSASSEIGVPSNYFLANLSDGTSVEIYYLTTGSSEYVPVENILDNSPASFVYFPSYSALVLCPGFFDDPTNNTPMLPHIGSSYPLVSVPIGFIVGSPPAVGDPTVHSLNVYTTIKSTSISPYQISYQNNFDENASYIGTYFNSLINILGTNEFYSDIKYAHLSGSGLTTAYTTTTYLTSENPINSFFVNKDFLGGTYFYVNYLGDNQNTIYVYYKNDSFSIPLQLVYTQTLSNNIRYFYNNNSSQYTIKFIEGSPDITLPYYAFNPITSIQTALPYVYDQSQDNPSSLTNGVALTTISSGKIIPYTDESSNLVIPLKDSYVVQNAISFASLSSSISGNIPLCYLVQTVDGSLFLLSGNAARLIYLSGGNNPPCTSISEGNSNFNFNAIIGSGNYKLNRFFLKMSGLR